MVDGIGPTSPVPEREEGNPTPRVNLANPNTSAVNEGSAPIAPPTPTFDVSGAAPATSATSPAPTPTADFALPQTPGTPKPADDPLANWHTQTPAMPTVAPPAPTMPGIPTTNNVSPVTPNSRRGLILAGVGVLAVLLVGGGAFFAFTRTSNQGGTSSEQTEPTPNPTPTTTGSTVITEATPSNMAQASASGTAIATSSATNSSSLVLTFDGANNSIWTPQVEVQPLGTAFTGTPSTTSTATIDGTVASVTLTGLTDGPYHWQARFAEGETVGPWVAYDTDEAAADFGVDTTAPAAPALTSVDGTAAAGNTVSVTSNRPVFVGTSEPNAKVTLALQPNAASLTATADASGNWSVTPDSDIPNGDSTISLTAADTAGNTSAASTIALGINSTPAAPAVSGGLAQTGENTLGINLLGLVMMLGSLATLGWIRRHART